MQLKILHRAHVAPTRLSKYRKDVSLLCLKCKTGIGDLTVSGPVLRYKSVGVMSYLKYERF